MDTFVRQNSVDLSGITAQVFLNPVTLGASHRALYQEHELFFTSVAMRERATANLDPSEMQKRFKEMNDCKTVENALLRGSSVSSSTLQDLITFREQQATDLEDELRTALDVVYEIEVKWQAQHAEENAKKAEKEEEKQRKMDKEQKEKENKAKEKMEAAAAKAKKLTNGKGRPRSQ